jgi:hypothetical protein
MKNHRVLYFMAFLSMSLLFWTCTDLQESPFSSVTPESFYTTEQELVAAVVPVYNNLYRYFWNPTNLAEVSSDEIFVPTRGGDWDDNGRWRAIHQHTWTSTLVDIGGGWLDSYRGIAFANSTLENLDQSPQSGTQLVRTFKAEVRMLRAFYYWWLCDMFGGVPIVTAAVTDPDNPPTPNTRQEVYDFIVAEVTEVLPQLETSHTAANYGRVTQGSANAFLATVYLNAEVYTGTPRWNECVASCDAIINSGLYELLPEYGDNFLIANEGAGNTETIFVIPTRPEADVSFTFIMRTMHYNQLPTSPWNGFAVVADFYNTFDTTDVRFGHMLVGPQFVLAGPNAGEPAYDRQGERLDFTVESPLIGATEHNGPRILKWEPDPNASGGDNGNDYAFFRYSHILLAKAEALNELNGPNQESIDLINQVRARCFDPDKPLVLGDYASTADLRAAILDERGFELLWEGYRRQDQIRHGTFGNAWNHKDVSEPYRELFPIPQTQVDANPNLVQNPGY